MSRTTTTAALLAIVASLTLAASCADDAAAPIDRPRSHDLHRVPSNAAAQPTPLVDGVLTIQLDDFSFENLPETVPAGTKLAVDNSAPTELHELVAFRINDTETRSVDELIALPESELLAVAGPVPATVLLAAPGAPQVTALGDGSLNEPGRYLLLCSIPTGVDPDEYLAAAATSIGPPDIPGGPPHFEHGMYAELVVE